MRDGLNKASQLIHAGMTPHPGNGAVIPPIFQTSTYKQEGPGVHQGYDYSRADNPTREAVEQAVAASEGAHHGLTFSSGLAAVQAVLQSLEKPGKVLVCDDVYGGTGRLFRTMFAKYGFEFQFIDMTILDQVEQSLADDTVLVWVETPTNPTLKVIDIKAVCERTRKIASNAMVVVDNTFCSPIFQSPLKLGADVVLHSTTKYMGGHSDMIGGALMVNDRQLFDKLKYVQFAAGAVPSPFESYLLHRSLKTLDVRMQRHAENADKVARFLEAHEQVEKTIYPGLESHPQHAVARSQCDGGFSGIVSFYIKGDFDTTRRFFERLNVFTLAESLGGVESLVNHPETMTHASVPESLRKELGINSQLIRLSVGIENSDDLLLDLDLALKV